MSGAARGGRLAALTDRILPGWQSAVARFLGADTRREGRRR